MIQPASRFTVSVHASMPLCSQCNIIPVHIAAAVRVSSSCVFARLHTFYRFKRRGALLERLFVSTTSANCRQAVIAR
jgi:hypothetical protein